MKPYIFKASILRAVLHFFMIRFSLLSYLVLCFSRQTFLLKGKWLMGLKAGTNFFCVNYHNFSIFKFYHLFFFSIFPLYQKQYASKWKLFPHKTKRSEYWMWHRQNNIPTWQHKFHNHPYLICIQYSNWTIGHYLKLPCDLDNNPEINLTLCIQHSITECSHSWLLIWTH